MGEDGLRRRGSNRLKRWVEKVGIGRERRLTGAAKEPLMNADETRIMLRNPQGSAVSGIENPLILMIMTGQDGAGSPGGIGPLHHQG